MSISEGELLKQLRGLDESYQAGIQTILSPLSEPTDDSILAAMLEALGNPDKDIRMAAVEALAVIGDSNAIPALAKILHDQSYEIRMSGAVALDKLGWQPSTEEQRIRYHFAALDMDQLNSLGTEGISIFVEALDDQAYIIRSMAAAMLGGIGDSSVLPILLQKLYDKHKNVRAHVVRAISRFNDPRIIAILIECLYSQWSEIRSEAAIELTRLGWQPSSEQEMIRYYFANGNWQELVQLGAKAIPILIAALDHPEPRFRSTAISVLGDIGDLSVIPVLIKAFSDPIEDVRATIADTLGDFADPRVIPALIEALHDPIHHVRMKVALALGRIGDPHAVPALIERLQDVEEASYKSNSERVCHYAAQALDKIGTAEALAALHEWRSQDEKV